MVFLKISTPFRHKIGRDTSFCDATTNAYGEIVLKIFINTSGGFRGGCIPPPYQPKTNDFGRKISLHFEKKKNA